MKKLIKITSGVAFMFLLALALSSFSSTTETVDENPGGVEVVKDGVRCYQSFNCGGLNCSEKQTLQYKNGELHMRTTIYQLPPGHCDIPEGRALVTNPSEGYRVIYTPSGKVIAKRIYNN